MRTRAARLAGAVVIGLAVAGCGGSAPSPPAAVATPAAPVFNQVDVDFVAHMSQHHGQALLMAELAATKAKSAAVKRVARRIAELRAPEVDRFGAWLAAWGEAGAEMPPHGIGGKHNGPGMLAEADVDRLGAASGAGFDRLFLDLMVRHHRGGTALTKAEVAGGRNPEVVHLARDIRTSAAAAVTDMTAIRNKLGA